ncbi:MAG: hypothetical protein J7496_10415 [Novosphingobium sp.]|nr:hypothetical protein [Novosphingobium sp.]MBO9602907.1 hypothetical protein [Novosphingobium sp.]
MRAILPISLLLALAACGGANDDQSDKTLSNKAATEIVKQVNDASVPIQPEPILEHEIKRLRFRSAGCVFSPGSGGHGAMVLAMKEAGYMKVDGEMIRFAADSGSPEIRPGVRSRYFGTSHWFRLSFTDKAGGAHLTVGDHADNIVFDAEGKVWCDGDNT